MDKIDFRHEFDIKDSGTRTQFEGGMVRDADAGDKTDYTSVMFGPMFERWAVHCTKGRVKYPDSAPGIPNWTLASSIAEWLHARGSLLRHTMAFLRGETDEDHAAAIMFNVNVMEYVRERIGWAPDVFISAPVSEDNAGPEEWGTPVDLSGKPFSGYGPRDAAAPSLDDIVNDATEQALPFSLTEALTLFDEGGSYIGPRIPEYDPSPSPDEHQNRPVVSGRLVRRGLAAIAAIDDFQADEPWCDSQSPEDDEIGGGVWHCERPPGHDGDHAWSPLDSGWGEDPSSGRFITRWGQNTLYRLDTEELPDE